MLCLVTQLHCQTRSISLHTHSVSMFLCAVGKEEMLWTCCVSNKSIYLNKFCFITKEKIHWFFFFCLFVFVLNFKWILDDNDCGNGLFLVLDRLFMVPLVNSFLDGVKTHHSFVVKGMGHHHHTILCEATAVI